MAARRPQNLHLLRAGWLVLLAAAPGCSDAPAERTDAADRREIAVNEAGQSPLKTTRRAPAATTPAKSDNANQARPLNPGAEAAVPAGADAVVAVNGGTAEIFRGTPVIVVVALFPDRAASGPHNEAPKNATPLSLSAIGGDWSSVVRWEVHNDNGQRQDWPFQLAPPPSPTLTASPAAPIALKATLSAEESQRIAVGGYRIVVVIDPAALSGANANTALRSDPISLALRDEPAELSPAQQSGKQHVRAMFWWLRGDFRKAFAEIDEHLKREPHDLALLALKSELLAETGDTEAAFEACGLAIDAHLKKYGTRGHPPAALLIRQRDLLNALLDKDAAAPAANVARAKARPLSDADLLALLRLEIGDKAILEKIRKDGVRVQFDEGLRKRLREAGATPAVLAAIESAAGKPAAEKPLSFEDVLALLHLDIPSDAILKRLQESAGRPTLSSEQKEALRKAGASAKLLEYLDDRALNLPPPPSGSRSSTCVISSSFPEDEAR